MVFCHIRIARSSTQGLQLPGEEDVLLLYQLESWVLLKADAILNGNTRSTVFCKHLANGFANFVVCSSARFNLFADEGPCYVHC